MNRRMNRRRIWYMGRLAGRGEHEHEVTRAGKVSLACAGPLAPH